ncbi:MAG: hypothetical protein GX268_06445 [Methanomicrobiales archaeon]|nr:hypothetical protein [Methanomicrobiales archaeon]
MKPQAPVRSLLLSVIIIAVCTGFFQVSGTDTPESGILEITTDEDLKEYLKNVTPEYRYDYINEMYYDMAPSPVSTVAQEMASPAATKAGSSDKGASDFSTTNIQVAGVDEADFVKNDGKYIYIKSGETLTIVDAFPPEQGKIVFELPVKGSVSELFLAGDRLVVFSDIYDEHWYTPEGSAVPVPDYSRKTKAVIYDISDRKSPKEVRAISAPGSYENARMTGNYVYFITKERPDYSNPRMPIIYDGTRPVEISSIWCPPYPMNEYQMHTLTSFPVTGSGQPDAESFLLGYSSTLYVSHQNVYVAYEKQRPWLGWLLAERRSAESKEPEQESVIHRFAIKDGDITYKSTGIVPGYLLNQFSLDENRGNLRVATTVPDWSSDIKQYSNVYVFDPDLKIIGRLEHLAPEEKIYSARFMGDLLYLVTFKQTDPLFVIDLSNPYQPGLLGELKIPGYSDYLHPYDDTHLIGIGKDTMENEWGGIIPTGVKIALFDVSNVNNPRLVESIVIGEKGSDSAVLSDHRAFLLDKEKNIMAIPVREVVHIPVQGSRYEGSHTKETWQGTYVFGIDPEAGFTEKGRIKQGTGTSGDEWWYGSTVLRSLFMDDVLYTISRDRIVGSDLRDLTRRLMDIGISHDDHPSYYF